MGHIVESIEIPASPRQIWEYVQDYRRRTEWDVTVAGFEPIGGSEISKGTTVRIRTAGFPKMEYEAVYVSFSPYQVSAIKMTRPISNLLFIRAAGSWRYQEIGENSTRFTMSFEYTPKWGRVGLLLDRLILSNLIRTQTKRALRNLRTLYARSTSRRP